VIEDRSVLTRAAPPSDQTLSYGTEPEQLADIRSGQGSEGKPLLVLVHGGFWRPAYDRLHLGCLSAALAGAGYSVANIEYRRIPGKPGYTLEDVRRAVEHFTHQLRSQHNGRVLLVGHSAGGHLTLWGASQIAMPALAGALALAPVADLELALRLELGDGAARAFLGPERAHSARFDPRRLASPRIEVCILHGDLDQIVPIAVSESYLANHPTAKLVRLANTGHFALIDPESGAWSAVSRELAKLGEF
jgi:acetyl esterase/lipase